jgi:hypothetical protein
MIRPSHIPLFNHLRTICLGAQIIKLLGMKFSPVACYSLSLTPDRPLPIPSTLCPTLPEIHFKNTQKVLHEKDTNFQFILADKYRRFV